MDRSLAKPVSIKALIEVLSRRIPVEAPAQR
jgi:hypothetical protein